MGFNRKAIKASNKQAKAEQKYAQGKIPTAEIVRIGKENLETMMNNCTHDNQTTEDGLTYCVDCTKEL